MRKKSKKGKGKTKTGKIREKRWKKVKLERIKIRDNAEKTG